MRLSAIQLNFNLFMGYHFKKHSIYTDENDSLASFTFSRLIFILFYLFSSFDWWLFLTFRTRVICVLLNAYDIVFKNQLYSTIHLIEIINRNVTHKYLKQSIFQTNLRFIRYQFHTNRKKMKQIE